MQPYTETEIKNACANDVKSLRSNLPSRSHVADPENQMALFVEPVGGETGGPSWWKNLNELPIRAGLGSCAMYLLGYHANKERDGRFRHVTVKLTLPKHICGPQSFFQTRLYFGSAGCCRAAQLRFRCCTPIEAVSR
jgi:hypothetical protein